MKKTISFVTLLLASTLLLTATQVQAADATAKPQTPQQQRMAKCGHESKGMKGDERKKFMHDCLSGKDVKAAGVPAAKPEAKPADNNVKPPVA